ncbi:MULTISPECIES: aspartate aminotransferase family protein [unclassified Beijerinckia]|uniref:aspartate aminotransferase family protein n=1 Tax=unclassified Beijerinckia TaxID=2638183 RepID=UPI0008982D90|nr:MULTISPECIES: aspartate aminotransferase family protein [unclassified Beijerinckia]MDH7796937.1 beta-alanine--pyruvate transaminase [Beijerinckia sp. GAS462]SEC65875.1 beta-alanine--pyruvate transaminase [Beijerinckia sp. 28-YEA-48]
MRVMPNDLDAYWMPFTANRQFKQAPRMLVSAKGMYYRSDDDRQILDGTSGLWCVNAGHGRPEIAEAVKEQLSQLDYAPSFQMGHPIAFEAASKLRQILPEGLNHVFFANSGSEAVDSALKIALAYHQLRGEGRRTRLIGRERGYHGVGFGGISVGGLAGNRRQFALLPNVDHLPHTHNLEKNAFSRGLPEWGAHLADELERLIALHDASTIAAVIVEPMAGSAGVLMPPKGYLERLRAICSQHGILLIFDEVITGFGRLGGHAFASSKFGIKPDMITMAKGLTNGTIPMGAVATSDDIYRAFMDQKNNPAAIELAHGYTYSGHPVACAAAIATIDAYRNDKMFEHAEAMAPAFEKAAHALRDAPHVIDIRNMGLVTGIELAPRPGQAGARAYETFVHCFENGTLIRVTGDIIALSPPLIISESQIDDLFGAVRTALNTVA